jgi:hypothetical protein
MDVDLSGDTTIRVALGDDEVNLSMGSPYVFPAPTREQLKASDQGAALEARGGVVIADGDDNDGGAPEEA